MTRLGFIRNLSRLGNARKSPFSDGVVLVAFDVIDNPFVV